MFNPSVNIQRDNNKKLLYFPTSNGRNVAKLINSEFNNGQRSFLLIGSYGTGKSAFLWAFDQSITTNEKYKYYNVDLCEDSSQYESIRIVGEYDSIITSIANQLELEESKDQDKFIISNLFNRYKDIVSESKTLLIYIDEFGKFIEYAVNNNSQKDLYFIQQLSEFCNNNNRNIGIIATIHQSLDSYTYGLNGNLRNEWNKVKGRFREIAFNEPIEQLLYLAAEHLKGSGVVKSPKGFNKITELILDSKVFGNHSAYLKSIAKYLLPLDILSAYTVTIGLQKYGQNERSLFSFLESTDDTSILKFKNNNSVNFYNLSDVYDYFIFNFYSFINSKYNPDFIVWRAIRSSLQKVERLDEELYSNLSKLIKTIGLLNLVAPKGSVLDLNFLKNYATECLEIEDSDDLINILINKKIIIYRNHSSRYILTEGTDIDIQLEIEEASTKIEAIKDIASEIHSLYSLPPILAKRYSYQSGTPRVFEFRITSTPTVEKLQGSIDGFINLIFNDKLTLEQLQEHSLNDSKVVVYCYYRNSSKIKNHLFEIAKTTKVLKEHAEDRVVNQELGLILDNQKAMLNHFILNGLTSDEVDWIYKGKRIEIEYTKITSLSLFNKVLSSIAESVYFKAPVFVNELINRNKITPAIQSARRNYFARLVNNWHLPQLGFSESEFPPEKAIYISLIQATGLILDGDTLVLNESSVENKSFIHLIECCKDFIHKTQKSRTPVSELVEILQSAPFKLKAGFIDFWLPTFLFAYRNDYALFYENKFVAEHTAENLELLVRYPHKFEIKAFEIDGVKIDFFNQYRSIITIGSTQKFSSKAFVETIRPFLSFYNKLPAYTLKTKKLSKSAIRLREVIATAKDPEKVFFEDFPKALGVTTDDLLSDPSKLAEYISGLQGAIKELRTAFEELIHRFEACILELIGFETLGESLNVSLQLRFKNVKLYLATPEQRTFVQRVNSKLDDKRSYLLSIAQVVLSKSLDSITDDEELFLFHKTEQLITSLDAVTSLSELVVNPEVENVYTIQLGNSVTGVTNANLRLPKNKEGDVSLRVQNIRNQLSNDKSVDIAALSLLLKELIQGE